MTAAFQPTFPRPPRTRLAFAGSWGSIAGLSLASCLAASARMAHAQSVPSPSPQAPSGEAGRGTGATIAVDPETNSLVIVGSPREVERLAELARQAQNALPVESSRIYSIALGPEAGAERLRSLVVQTLRTMNSRGGVGAIARRVSVVADPSARSLVVTASPGDFRVVGELIAAFARTPESERLTVRNYPLENVTADQASRNLRALLDAQRASAGEGPISVRLEDADGSGVPLEATFDPTRVRAIAEPVANTLVVIAPEEAVAFVDRFVSESDALPTAEQASLKVYTLKHASAEQLVRPVTDLLSSRWRDQRRRDPSLAEPRVVADPRNNALIVSAARPQLAELGELLATLDGGEADTFAGGGIEIVPVRFAEAAEVARTLDRFLTDRARSAGLRDSEATVAALGSSNALILGGSADAIASLKGLIAEIDLPQTGDRAVEIVRIRRGDARSIARLVGEQFSRRVIGGTPIAVSADTRTNSVIVNAPNQVAEEVLALIASLDSPDASDETILRTYQLTTARADEAVRLLTASLQLDSSGRADGVSIRLDDAEEAVEVNARIVPDRRSNSLIVTATPESVPVIEALITRIDEAPASSPLEFRIVPLEHATAADASYTLRQMLRAAEPGQTPPAIDYNSAENQLVIGATSDQFPRIEELIDKLDQPRSRPRRTDFIALEFADAERVREALSYFYGPWADQADRPSQRNVSIVADPATNSLVISAEENEWEGIEGLLAKLDREDYDGSLQLRVFALAHADARGLARAINDAFRGQMEELRRRGRGAEGQRDRESRDQTPPTTLVPAEEWVSVAAEENTNSLVVSASRANLNRIERIIEELDTADFGRLPAPRVIPVARGDAEQLAEAIVEAYDLESDGGSRTVRVVGDRTASALIVRAGDADFEQIRTLAERLQEQAASQGLSVSLLTLENAPAARVADAIREAYALRARQANLPLTISVDGSANALVVASTGPLFEEIRETAEAMDRLSPKAGQAIFLIDLEHVDPEIVEQAISEIGLDEEQDPDSARRIVGEPVRVATLPGRRSILVVANPADRNAITGFVKAIDEAPSLPASQLRVVRLEIAEASAVASILEELVDPTASAAGSDLARAAREQIRRLGLRRDGIDAPDLALDLDTPIRILADDGLNALLIDSSPENVEAIETIAGMLDELPVTSAVTVQFLPLEHIAAAEFARLVREVFEQGADVGRIPGTNRAGVPAGAVGPALLEPVAMTVDERTNTVIVAGREEAVALVEVLKQRVDDGIAMGWVEPRVIALQYADAVELAATLEAVLVGGRQDLPDAIALQRQVGRLRVALDEDGKAREVEGDIFRPMTELLVRPDRPSNALVAVGSPGNLEVVEALVAMLDVEAAAPGATVRTFAIQHASAGRVATLLEQLFTQQYQAKLLREEDRVRVIADERINSIVVSTSNRSFQLVEELLATLDAEVAPDLREIRMLALENAAASRVAPIVQQMMDARLERLRRVQPETADLEKALVLADPRANALVVAAGNDAYEVISRLAKDLDAAPPDDASLVEVVAVRGGDMNRLVDTIDRVMERRYADLPADVSKRSRPLVLTDPRTGSLLVTASPEDVEAIRKLVEQLEGMPMNAALGLAVVQVDRGRAVDLAPRLERLMIERTRSLGSAESPSDRVSILADPASNSLLVAANESNVETVRELVRLLEQSELGDADLPVEVFMLARGRAGEMLPTIRSMYVDEANRSRGPNTVRVSADDRLNAIVVAAPAEDVAAIRSLVERLDGTAAGTVVDIKYIPLASANAVEMVGLVETVLSGGGIGRRRGGAMATVVRYLREIDGGGDGEKQELEVEISQATRESISLVPDVRTNTVIVRAPGDSIPLLERMIRDLDESTLGGQNIRVFQLTNADADAMAQILRELFNLRQRGNMFVLRPREIAEEVELELPAMSGPPGLSSTELTMVPDERQQLSITVDSRTNSLLVSGTSGYLDLVSKVVEELDAAEANERETFVYRLKNATAEEVAEIVGQFVSEDQRKVVQTLGSDELPSAARLLEREVTIVGDVKSNSVVVTASPRYADRVRDIIKELDIDPPQVLIQVLLAEVELSNDERLGLEFTRFTAGNVDVAGGFGLPRTPFDRSSGVSVPGLAGLAPALFANGIGVPNIAVGSADFDLLINALESQNRVQVLSNPSVMVANNSEGFIQVGDTVRLPDAISFSSAGQQSAVTPEDIGVILRVTPTINPDGYVRMEIEPEISRLSRESIQISENFESPVITRRRANTTVTVKDGQTVVIGGLISDRYENIEKKVPLLGDIPLLGELFRNKSETIEKTELLIVLTPHVINNNGDSIRDARMEELSKEMIDKLSLDPPLLDQIRRGELDGLQGQIGPDGERIDTIGAPSATTEQEVGFLEPPKAEADADGAGEAGPEADTALPNRSSPSREAPVDGADGRASSDRVMGGADGGSGSEGDRR